MRTSRTNGSTTYSYVYNGGQLSQMTVGGNTLNFAYDASGTPLSVVYNGTYYYYVTNLQGDVVAILDHTGAAQVRYTYDAWGRVMSTTEDMASTLGVLNPLRYRGYVYDPEFGLYYLQSRYYNPAMGRFINADAFTSTGQGILGNNMFAYCGNNPVTRKDSAGMAYVFLDEFIAEVDPDGPFDESGGGGGGWGLGVNPSYYTARSLQPYDWDWQNSSYNQNTPWPNEQPTQEPSTVDTFDSLITDPTSVVGKTPDDLATELGDGWTKGTYGTEGTGWKFTNRDKLVAYHPGGGRHVGSYYKLSSAKSGKIKVVGPDYVAIPGDRAKIIWYN